MKSVKQRSDFARSGQWEVVTEDKDGQQQNHVFDAVICCSGHYTYPNLPLKDFPGNNRKWIFVQTDAPVSGGTNVELISLATMISPLICSNEETKKYQGYKAYN